MSSTDTVNMPQTMALQGFVNSMMRALLRTPVLCRLIGRKLITMYVVGRKSGRLYRVPVAYTRADDALLVGTAFAWARNLRTGDRVAVRLNGRRREMDVAVRTDEPGVVADYAIICRGNHSFAGFNKIALDAGEPVEADLHAAWRAGARVLRLMPVGRLTDPSCPPSDAL